MKTSLKNIYSDTTDVSALERAKVSIHTKLKSAFRFGYLGAFALLTLSSCGQSQKTAEAEELDSSQVPIEMVAQNVALQYPSLTTLDNPDEDSEEKNRFLLTLLVQALTQQHYQPLALDDDFAGKTFDLFLTRMDNNKRYFTKDDFKKIEAQKNQIDEQAMQGDYTFFNTAYEIFEERLKESEEISKEVLSQPFDFSKNESIELDGDKTNYAADKAEQKDRWRKLLKYQVMVRLDDLLLAEEKKAKEEEGYTAKSVEELEKDARERVQKNQDEFFKRMYRLKKKDWRNLYLNSITSAYDPHTEYYPPKDKENFDIQFSGQFEGIGATLQEREGEIKVMAIVPGSASWKQGELKEGDIIQKVAQGDEEPVSIIDMPLDDAVQLIRGKKGSEVRLTVKKVDGTTKIIPIIRDVVILAETYAKSAVLEPQKGKKIGYIKLPSFYADFRNQNGRNSSSDMKEELEKLNDENVEGLILDLRNNGGGSLADVIKIVGHFIETGPVVQVKQRGSLPQVYSDNDKEVVFDKPLIVLVNEFSASASEIFAAAVQDYNRGIVVGSPTFGKGSVQNFMDLDRVLGNDYDNIKPLGALKLTIQKYYRINGGATQLKGVVPDITLPDMYSYIDFGEEQEPYALKWDEIREARYKEWNPSYKLSKVQEDTKKRVSKDGIFSSIDENAKRLKKRRDETLYSLNLEEYRTLQRQLEEESKKYENLAKADETLKIFAVKKDLKEIESDTVKQASFDKFEKELKKDIHLQEAIRIMNQVQ
ncbi:carboxy terminal-processing peptidase [Bernardetia sp.]|uniref:carboxy terminal-processing peptidase n=1 Tax=Bernardetia sp. TaxID=1937974 RepID=UPI0025BED7A9|nr:carboxy terminal-processing peptidase [Bernardetia sp.]